MQKFWMQQCVKTFSTKKSRMHALSAVEHNGKRHYFIILVFFFTLISHIGRVSPIRVISVIFILEVKVGYCHSIKHWKFYKKCRIFFQFSITSKVILSFGIFLSFFPLLKCDISSREYAIPSTSFELEQCGLLDRCRNCISGFVLQ